MRRNAASGCAQATLDLLAQYQEASATSSAAADLRERFRAAYDFIAPGRVMFYECANLSNNLVKNTSEIIATHSLLGPALVCWCQHETGVQKRVYTEEGGWGWKPNRGHLAGLLTLICSVIGRSVDIASL